jgi:hypothetical protein
VRLVTRLPANGAGVPSLLASALEWSKSFEDSIEQPNLVGRIYAMQAGVSTSLPDKKAKLDKSRQAYQRGGDLLEAVWQAQRLVRVASSEGELHEELGRCFQIAEARPVLRVECVEGVGSFLYQGARRLTDRAKLKPVLDIARAALPDADRRLDPAARMAYRGTIAKLAAVVGDLDVMRRFDGEVRDYYSKTSPNTYMLTTHLGQIGRVLSRFDPALATERFLEFARVGGASDYWRAEVYFEFADTARRGGNADAERQFLEEGRRASRAHRQYAFHYDVYPVRAAIEKRAWFEVERTYAAAEAAAKRDSPRVEHFEQRLRLGQAVTRALRRDANGALWFLKQDLARVRDAAAKGEAGPSPCFNAQLLEVAASVEAARGTCEAATELRGLAAKTRERCVQKTCQPAPGGGEWCDTAEDNSFKGSNACRESFPEDPDLLPR